MPVIPGRGSGTIHQTGIYSAQLIGFRPTTRTDSSDESATPRSYSERDTAKLVARDTNPPHRNYRYSRSIEINCSTTQEGIRGILLVTRRIRFRRIPHWPAGLRASLVERWAEAAGWAGTMRGRESAQSPRELRDLLGSPVIASAAGPGIRDCPSHSFGTRPSPSRDS